jgi:hypothetical protein
MEHIGYGLMLIGIAILIWSLLRKSVSLIGLGVLIVGFIVELLSGR